MQKPAQSSSVASQPFAAIYVPAESSSAVLLSQIHLHIVSTQFHSYAVADCPDRDKVNRRRHGHTRGIVRSNSVHSCLLHISENHSFVKCADLVSNGACSESENSSKYEL